MIAPTASFRSGAKRAQITVIAFVALIIGNLLEPAISFWLTGLIERIETGGNWSQQEVEASDMVVGAFTLLYAAIYIATIVTFLMWFHRVRANLSALGITDARWSPGWAVGWWFVPVMNVFRPYQVTSEIWRASDPLTSPADWRYRSVPALLGWWWALYLIGSGVDAVSFRLWNRIDEQPRSFDLDILPLVDTAAAIVTVVGSVLIIRIIRGIDRRQSERVTIDVF